MRLLKYGVIAFISMMSPPSNLLRAAEGPSPSAASVAAVEAPELRSRYVEGVGGVPLNVIEAGDEGKPTLIFIHGFGQSHLSWEFQLRSELAKDYHLVAYDLRGHGNSGKPWRESDYSAPDVWAGDLDRVIKATTTKRPLLVSWSYGTWSSVDFLKTHQPEEIAGLVMVGGFGGLIPPIPLAEQKRSAAGEEASRMVNSAWLGDNFAGGVKVNLLLTKRSVDPLWSQRTAAVNAMLPPYVRPLILARSYDNSDAIGRIQIPTLFALGSEDITSSIVDAQRLQQRIPHAQIKIFKGSGHMPFAEDSNKFNEMLAEFASHAFKCE